jgi:hypothetical protein
MNSDPRVGRTVHTMEDEQCDALADEFVPFQVWIDFRPRDDGQPHWHARLPGWSSLQIISGVDVQDMRDRLIIYRREHPEQLQQSVD